MNEDGFEKRAPRQSGSGEPRGREQQGIAPGKVTRTSKIESPRAMPAKTTSQTPPALVQQKQGIADTARAERAALTNRWLDTVVRPDIYPPPVQRKPTRAGSALAGTLPASDDGQPLPEEEQAEMDSAFAADALAVRVHQGPRARPLDAPASNPSHETGGMPASGPAPRAGATRPAGGPAAPAANVRRPAAAAASTPARSATPSAAGPRGAAAGTTGPAAVATITPPASPRSNPAAGSAATTSSAARDALVVQIQAAGQAGKQRLAEQIRSSSAAITATVAAQKQVLGAAGAAQRAAVRAQVSAARAEAIAVSSQLQAQIEADSSARSAAVSASEAAAGSRASADTAGRQEQAHAVGDATAERATQHGEEKTNAAHTTVAELAERARNTGNAHSNVSGDDPDATSAKRQAATQLGNDTADGVVDNLSSLLGGVASTISAAASSLREAAGEVAAGFGEQLPTLLSQLADSASAAVAGIGELASGAVESLGQMFGQLDDQLGELEQSALTELDQALATKQAELDQAGEQAVSAFQEQGAVAQAAADRELAEAVTEAAGQAEADPAQARRAGAEVSGTITSAFDGLVAKIVGAEGQVRGSIEQMTAQAVAGLAGFATTVGERARAVVADARGKGQEHAGAVREQTQAAAERAEREASGTADANAEGMDLALEQTRSELDSRQQQVASRVDAQVDTDVGQVRGPVDSLAGRITGAQNAIDSQSAWDSFVGFLSSIGRWLEQQWDDFVEIIRDPGFWVGLVVGVLASFTPLGPIGGAMLGAAVGTIVSNLCATPPRPWHEGVIKNALIAGAFTLAIVAAVAGAVYLGAEALAVFIVVEVVTAVGTIIINVANGDRWDRGLLANMFIVGLLHLLFAKPHQSRVRVPRPGEPVPERPPGTHEPARPPEPAPGAPPRLFSELMGRLSAKAREAHEQQRQLRSEENMRQMEEMGRQPDGTYDVDAANRGWERKWMDPERFARARARGAADAEAKANDQIDRVNNTCRDNDGTGRNPENPVGDGTTEAAVRREAETGRPVGRRSHAQKAAEAARTLQDAVERLRQLRPAISDPDVLSRIDAAIARATERISRLQEGLRVWDERATRYPDVWYPNGQPRVPGFPMPPHVPDHPAQPDGGTPDDRTPDASLPRDMGTE